MAKKLGRGLSALIPTSEGNNSSTVTELNINKINKNPFQPRSIFIDDTIKELANSIKNNGLIQPIIVRELSPNNYELISGERRFRAVQLLGLASIPVIIKKQIADFDSMTLSLIENIQREDINAYEQAVALEKIKKEKQITQQELADLVGKSRSFVGNSLRLLDIHEKGKQALKTELISEGHARVLLHFKKEEDQDKILEKIIVEKLSVRDTEKILKNSSSSKKTAKNTLNALSFSGKNYSFKVKKNGNKGKVIISFNNTEELNQLKSLLLNA